MDEKSEAEAAALRASVEALMKRKAGARQDIGPPPSRPAANAHSRRPLFVAAALLFLALGAASASVALYCSSRSALSAGQRAAFNDLQQSLQRMEQKIATSETRRPAAPAAGERSSRPAPESSGLLDAANLRYREGQFKDAAAAYRAAMDMDLTFADETHYRYAESLLKTGQFDHALEEFEIIETAFPGSPYFASSAMEAAQLLFQKKSYSGARRALYELMAARDRLGPADKANLERAYFFVAQCYEAEAESLEGSAHAAPSAPQEGSPVGAAAAPVNAASEPSLPARNTQTEGK